DETACPYGTPSCVTCNKTCDGGLQLTGPYCGDHHVDSMYEECDDPSLDAGGVCPYGEVCTNMCVSCKKIPIVVGPPCGDGLINNPDGGERCDDGNTASCGSCNKQCTANRLASAGGTITAVSGNQIRAGETFKLDNGRAMVQVFEFTPDGDGGTASGNVLIIAPPVPENADVVADNIILAIKSTGLGIDAGYTNCGSPSSSCTVILSNLQPGIDGNKPITTTPANPQWSASGMTGGAGYDCQEGVGCASDQDCLSTLTCQGPVGAKTC